MKPSLHRLTDAAAASGAGTVDKGQQTTLTYYQATGITQLYTPTSILIVQVMAKVYRAYTCIHCMYYIYPLTSFVITIDNV